MRFGLLLIFSLVSLSVSGQAKKWTLDECMLYAVENSPRTAVQVARSNISKVQYRQALAALLPDVGANMNGSFSFGRSLGEDNTYVDRNNFNSSYGLSAGLTIFDGLSSIYRVKMQKINKLMGKHNLQAEEDLLAFETMEAFFNVQYYKGMVSLARQKFESSDVDLRQIERMEELGVKALPDVLEMRAQNAADQYDLTANSNLLTIALINLKEKMNFPIDEEFDIEEYVSEDMVSKTEMTALGIYSKSLDYLPQALAADASYQSQRMAHKAAVGSIFPSISLNAGFGASFYRPMNGEAYESFREQFDLKRNSSVGFSLNIPLFSGYQRWGSMRISKYQTVIAEKEKESSLRVLYKEIETAVSDMNGNADQYLQARRGTESAEAAHQVQKRKYEEGLVSVIEFNLSASNLLEARVKEMNSLLQYYLKRNLVHYYDGQPVFPHIDKN